MIAQIATTVMQLEERIDGQDKNAIKFIPDCKRLRANKASFDLRTRRGKVDYLTTQTASTGCGYVASHMEFLW